LIDRKPLGVSLLLIFLASTSLRDIYLSSTFSKFGFFEVAFVAFGAATICFLAITLVSTPNQVFTLRRAWRNVIAVNATTAVAWLSYFGSLRFVEPAVTNTVYSGVAPLTIVLFGACGLKTRAEDQVELSERAAHLGLIGALVVLAWIVLSGRSGLANLSIRDGALGLILATVSGVVITAETIFAKQMNDDGVSPAAVLGVRFFLVTLISAGFVFLQGETILRETPGSLGYLAGAALLLIAAPIYLVQLGLAYTSPMTTNVVLSLGPVFVLATQVVAGNTTTSPYVLFAIVLYAAFAVIGSANRVRAPAQSLCDGTGKEA
jgi:drug/metabolite transporter (DMT)-like permease